MIMIKLSSLLPIENESIVELLAHKESCTFILNKVDYIDQIKKRLVRELHMENIQKQVTPHM